MHLENMINERGLPPLPGNIRSKEDFIREKPNIRHILEEYAYGVMPDAPENMHVTVTEEVRRFCAAHAILRFLSCRIRMNGQDFSFPFFEAIPLGRKEKLPAFVYMHFYKETSDLYLPMEEITDRGYAVFGFCYKDVTSDDNDFTTGIAKYLGRDRRTNENAPGKIAMWAWAAMRVMDYVMTKDEIDKDRVAVMGHSRLGKTALLAGAYDERFRYVISNGSGCMGAALLRGTTGENYEAIVRNFPFWFCPRFCAMAPDAEKLPFDQHFLMSLSVPRHLLVGSAEDDAWDDPTGEFLTLYKTNDVYRLFSMKGLVTDDRLPSVPSVWNDGEASYHIRTGMHFLSRGDWNVYMDYMDTHR